MINRRLILSIFLLVAASCAPQPDSATSAYPSPTLQTQTQRLPPHSSNWQIQYNGSINAESSFHIYNLDLFDTDQETIAKLHGQNTFVMCYFSAGTLEDWRPDRHLFPKSIQGKTYEGWPGEKWLDIREQEILLSILLSRLDLARQKGCDGVDPDNLDGYLNDTGLPLTYQDQLAFNISLAEAAHARSLSIGLKNDVGQIHDLVDYFDWQLQEQCFEYDECSLLLPFVEAGKPVFNIEYTPLTASICMDSEQMKIYTIHKNLELDDYLDTCD